MEEIKEKNKKKFHFSFLEKLRNFKHLKTITVIVLSLIVGLIFISSLVPKRKQNIEKESVTNLSALAYCKDQENRIERILESVKGISNVKVFVMTSESPEIVYVTDKTETTTSGTTTTVESAVIVKNGTITNALVQIERLPKIMGVMIVAKGAGDLKMKTTLTNIIASVLGVNVSNVEVMEGK